MHNVIECNVWCSLDDKARDMGMPDGDTWMPFAIDFSTIEAIKIAGETDFVGDDKATIYFHGRDVTIDITYKEAVRIWKEILSNKKQ